MITERFSHGSAFLAKKYDAAIIPWVVLYNSELVFPNEFNYHGFVGASSGGVNLGMHGSMSPHEMNNVLICKG